MKRTILIFIIAISSHFVSGQTEIDSKDIVSQISSAEMALKIENYTIVNDFNFADIEHLMEGKVSTSRTIIKKNKHHSDTIVKYSQKNLAQIDTDLEFVSCVFEGAIDTKKRMKNDRLVSRINTQFNGNLSFTDCLFKEAIDLSSVEFEGDLIFVNCNFKKQLNLGGIRSAKKFTFERCTFDNICSFTHMLIAKKAVLDHCVFKDDLSFASTIFSVEPEILSSEFQSIMLRNCRIIDQPFFWYFEDDKSYELLLPKVKYEKTFYGTKLEHHKKMSIYTSRSNWGGGDSRKKILKLWDARAEIKSDDGKYKVWGRIVWDKNQHILIVDHAKLKAPNGDVLSEGEKLEIKINNPSNFKVL